MACTYHDWQRRCGMLLTPSQSKKPQPIRTRKTSHERTLTQKLIQWMWES
jgi:hypothetical protein